MTLFNIPVSGSGEYDLGSNQNVTDVDIYLNVLGPDTNVIESTVPARVSRCGWVALGADVSIDGTTVVKSYWAAAWIDFVSNTIVYKTEDYGARYIRWQLFFGTSGIMRVSF